MNCAVNSSAPSELRVGGIDDHIDLLIDDIADDQFNSSVFSARIGRAFLNLGRVVGQVAAK